MTRKTVIVLSLAGFSPSLLNSGFCPRIESFANRSGFKTIKPVLPALTLSMQATLTTGALPAGHGIVGNGFFDRTQMEQRFWSASSGLLERPRIWDDVKDLRVAALFWWNFLGADLDVYMNVAPFHMADGKTVPACYSRPDDLYPRLEKKLGPFPLHRFWGPAVSIESSKWILDATLDAAETFSPDLLLSYIPHMDYSLQRSGPDSKEANGHLAELDELLAPLLERAGDFHLVLLSEYGIGPVSQAVSPNRFLKEAGLFHVRRLGEREYPDPAGSRAFAVCDHQIAHIYAADRADREKTAARLEGLDGIAAVLDREGLKKAGLDHARSGDLVALAEENAWFEHSWWESEEAAPDYAFTVDIHRKIGYDPLELIFDPIKKRLASDPKLIRGSHGLVPETSAHSPLIITPFLKKYYKESLPEIPAVDVAGLLLKVLDHT